MPEDDLLCEKLFVYLPGQNVRSYLLVELKHVQFDRDLRVSLLALGRLRMSIKPPFLG